MALTNYRDIYNKTYNQFTPDWFEPGNLDHIEAYLEENNKTLIDFISDYFSRFNVDAKLADLSVLDAGCGLGGVSFYMADKCRDVVGVDISDLAIMGANSIGALKSKSVEFRVADLTASLCFEDKKFDIAIDSHLFHCLTEKVEREAYLKVIKESLSDDGFFIAESMVFHPGLQIPLGYRFDEDNVLYKEVSESEVAIRKVATSHDLEKELTDAGFKINYFYYHNELGFDVFTDYKSYPFDYLPKTVRFVASRND